MQLRYVLPLALACTTSSSGLMAQPATGDDGAKPDDAAGDAPADSPTDKAEPAADAEEPKADAPEADNSVGADPESGDATSGPDGEEKAEQTDEQKDAVEVAQAGDSPVELPGKTYYFVGARYRAVIVPKFMQNLFADGGRTIVSHGFGPEFAIRKDGFEYNFSAWFADYSMQETPFKSSSDGEKAWEIIESELKMIYLTTDFLWSQEFTPSLALNYGAGFGFGIVFGDLFRTQAIPPGNREAGDPYTYQKCNAPGSPAGGDYCDNDNEHYNGFVEPSWAGGGSVPVIFPWLALQAGLRFKPHKNFVARLDAGFGTSGFFAGLGLDYGL